MKEGLGIARLPFLAFILLCLVSSAFGFIFLGVLGAAISELLGRSDSLITLLALIGLIVPVIFLVLMRRRQLRGSTKTAESVRALDSSPLQSSNAEAERLTQIRDDLTGPLRQLKSGKLWAAAIVGAIITIWAYISSNHNLLGLEVVTERNFVVITNKDSTPIKILDWSINGRKECSLNPDDLQKQFPKELKMGDQMMWPADCEVVRVDVRTNKGSASFSFN
jgi:hypothetical protein